MSKDPIEYLRHILDECTFILSEIPSKKSKVDFLADEVLKRAAIRSLEIIGEASKKIPADYKAKYNNIQWKDMVGMRDRLIHDYMGVNYSIVWDVIMNKIPDLSKQIEEAIKS